MVDNLPRKWLQKHLINFNQLILLKWKIFLVWWCNCKSQKKIIVFLILVFYATLIIHEGLHSYIKAKQPSKCTKFTSQLHYFVVIITITLLSFK